MAWDRKAYMRAYTRWHKPIWRAQMRARGLCIQCCAISEKYVRCLKCRRKARASANRRSRAQTRRLRARVDVPYRCPEMGGSSGLDSA